MVNVHPVSRAEIDAWPIEEAGVPVRVSNCARAAGWHTVGEVRPRTADELLSLRSFGRTSLRQWRAFLRQCDRLERGRIAFEDIRQAFAALVDPWIVDILALRYRFDEPGAAARRRRTLHDIGRRRRLTRERVRQIQVIGLARLRSRFARVCLEPFCARIESKIAERGGTVTFDDLAPLAGDAVLGGMNPASLVMLLHDLFPERCHRCGLLFSLLPPETLMEAERQAIQAMDERGEPLTVEDILPRVTALAAIGPPNDASRCARCSTALPTC
jgi:hypothetical protein